MLIANILAIIVVQLEPMINAELKERFEKVIEIKNIDWAVIDEVAMSDANILRPIKGIAFEEYLKKIILQRYPNTIITDGVGDSDIDLIVNDKKVQVKTIDKGSTRPNIFVGVALHKTHGDETRPNNLYKKNNPTFDILAVLHPDSGVLLIPYSNIPTNKTWTDHLADPAQFDWNSEWLNKWSVLDADMIDNETLDTRIIPQNSMLPNLSRETYLEDYEIIEMLCKPQYFRAAVMGLKGNIKEHWFKNKMKSIGLITIDPIGSYSKCDVIIQNKQNQHNRVQVKGTSKNMCSLIDKTIGFEIMGTHGQFPHRGYKKSSIDYVSIIVSEDQLPKEYEIEEGLHFVLINVDDLPLHYLVGNGTEGKKKEFANEKWNHPEYSDILYPNIKLKHSLIEKDVHFLPHISSYRKNQGYDTIPLNSGFRNAGPFILDKIPEIFL